MAETFFLGPSAVQDLVRQKGLADANPGLVWERYLPVWEGSPDRPARAKLYQPLQDFVSDFNARSKERGDLLAERNQRLGRALDCMKTNGHAAFEKPELQLVWRLTTGLGSNHPTENGFNFDAPTGSPFITGSAVKGMCRRAAELDGISKQEVERLFGPERISADEPSVQGELIFFDAFPTCWPSLVVDIVNCHHPAYYQGMEKNGEAVPRETEDPVPVFFLAVDQGASFTFPIGAKSQSQIDTATRLLGLGLDWLGIGAKTAVGYGVFRSSASPKPSTEKTSVPPADTLGTFKSWFDKQGYAGGRNKGQLNLVQHKLRELPAEQRAVAIEYTRQGLKKTMKAAELEAWLARLASA